MVEERLSEVERELLGLRRRVARMEAVSQGELPGRVSPAAPDRAVPRPGPVAGVQTSPPAVSRQANAAPVTASALHHATANPDSQPTPTPAERAGQAERAAPAGRRPEPALRPPSVDLEDLLGGRVLAWLGGVAVLVGLAFLLALGISSGVIGEGARVLMGGLAAVGLIGGGIWLHDQRGRTDAALASLAAGLAAMFAVAGVGSQVYDVIPSAAGLTMALGTGALATWLAVRWRSQGIAALGILGAMVAPAMAGVDGSLGSVTLVFVAAASAAVVLVHQGWRWLSVGVLLVALPQWAAFVLDGSAGPGSVLATLVAFALLGAVVAVGHELRDRPEVLGAASALMLAVNALAVGAAGWFALVDSPGRATAVMFLWALAAGHGLLAVAVTRRRDAFPGDLGLLLMALATLVGNLAFAATVHGPARSLGWAVAAVGFAAVLRRRDAESAEGVLSTTGLGGHLALAMLQVLTSDVSPSLVGPGQPLGLAAGGSLVGLAAACFASGRLAEEQHTLRVTLDVLGLAALGYLTALTLDGTALTVAYAGEAIALAGIAQRTRDAVTAWAAPLVWALAAALALVQAPPEALGVGLAHPLEATAALGAVVLAALGIARLRAFEELAPWLIGAAALGALYLASVLLVTPFQPTGAAADATLLDLPVRQQGQVLLSVLWAGSGLLGVMIGLGRDLRPVRLAALALLGAAVAKVFFYDLSTLTSVYRVISFVGLGVLMLGAAFAWQRVRPRDLEDLRDAPAALR